MKNRLPVTTLFIVISICCCSLIFVSSKSSKVAGYGRVEAEPAPCNPSTSPNRGDEQIRQAEYATTLDLYHNCYNLINHPQLQPPRELNLTKKTFTDVRWPYNNTPDTVTAGEQNNGRWVTDGNPGDPTGVDCWPVYQTPFSGDRLWAQDVVN
jgi:hypothetical protein